MKSVAGASHMDFYPCVCRQRFNVFVTVGIQTEKPFHCCQPLSVKEKHPLCACGEINNDTNLTLVNETRKLPKPLINQQLGLANCSPYLSKY